MSLQEVTEFLHAALESSVYLAPREPGLTFIELVEVGTRAKFEEGEINDALRTIAPQPFGGTRRTLLPNPHTTIQWGIFGIAKNPDYRNFTAFDFVCSQ